VDVALENAREGCVGETYAAAVALWQAERAGDPEVRAAMAGIARDEIAHAQLAWDVDAWAASRLSPAQVAACRQRRREAGARLAAAAGQAIDERLASAAGLPSPAAAAWLAGGTRDALWR
jgi:hypothetical protein